MSQLNPNAAEFVPIASPTRNVASPACRALLNDQVIAQSPRKATPTEIDINLPNPQDFENEVKSRPSDLFNNSQDSENNQKLSSQEVMENLLNGKNIDDIEFHPASTPVKVSNPEEFHFGPNATPFSTPAKLMDQSEAALSTKAEFGDESSASYLEGKTLESENTNPFTSGEDVQDFHTQLNKPTDPMSMSFYQDENDSNPFDLNKVQMLPDDDEFAEKPENDSFANETISDLPEHDPLGHNELVTDLDKPADTQCEDLFGFSKLPQTPEPSLSVEQEIDKKEELIGDLPIAKSPILIEASKAPLPITPEPNFEEQNIILNKEEISSPIPPKSPLPDLEDNFGICDVKPSVESDLIVVSEQRITPIAFSPELTELADVFSKSPLPVDDRLMPHDDLLSKSPLLDDNLSLSHTKSPYVISPEPVISPEVTEDLLCQSKSPIPLDVSKSPVPTSELVTEITEKPDENTEEFFKLGTNTETSKPSDVLDNINFQETDYFPICSKSPVSEVPPLIHDTKEEFQETEYFPICSKSPVSDVPPLELESKAEIQEQTIFTELINIKETLIKPIPLEIEPEILNVGPSKSPEPTLTDLTSTIIDACESNLLTEVPKDEIVDVKPLVPPPQEILSAVEVSDLLQKLSETENENKISQSFSPEPIESPKEQLQNLQMSEQLLINEIQNILDAPEPVVPTECDAKSPETIEESLDSEKRDLESPMEDITSSVKDDNSLTPEIIEEAKDFSTEKEIKRDDVPTSAPQLEISNQDYAQELCSAMQEHSETILEKEVVCQVSSTPNTTLSIDTESVNTADVNSFLNRSNVLDVTSPLSPNEQTELLPTEDIVKTDLITPQYPEEAVITPSEETKTETPIADNTQAPTALPEVVSEAEIKEKEEVADKTISAPVIGVAAAVATAAAATTAIVKDKKSSSKSLTKAQPPAKKTTKPATTTLKTTTKPISGKTSTTSKSSVLSPTKPLPTAAKTTKPPTTTKPPITSRITSKPSPKPKTEVPVTKSVEKKTLTNGDVKALPRTSPAVRKIPATSTVPARISLTSKLSPTKTDSKSSVTKTSTTTVTKSTKETVPKTTSSTLSAVPKPRPTSLTSKPSSATKTTSSVSTTKTTVQSSKPSSTIASSPRTTTAKSKPPTSLTAKPPMTVPKPRLAPRTPTKGPDTEKQLKDSVNKQLTATRTTTTTKTSGTFSTGRTTTTVKKTEMKSPSTRTSTTTKTTITTIKPTTKKPAEITRINKKTAPTKTTIKSQENGLTNGVTTIVQETTTILSTEPQLIKDLSPVENKLIVDNSQLSETNVAD